MGDWNSYEARPSLEGGSVEGPSLEEDCGPSGGECPFYFPNSFRRSLTTLSIVEQTAERSSWTSEFKNRNT